MAYREYRTVAELRWLVAYHLYRARALDRAGRYQDAAGEEAIAEMYNERLWMLTDRMGIASLYARSPYPSTDERVYMSVEEGIAQLGLARRYPLPSSPALVWPTSPPPIGLKGAGR